MRHPSLSILLLVSLSSAAQAADVPATATAPAAANATIATTGNTTAVAAPTPEPVVPVTAAMDLFNGKDLDGITFVCPTPTDVAKVCSVKDGVLVVAGKPNGYLEFPHARGNYKLHMEWRFTTENRSNNGGVLLNISPGPLQQNLWPVSIQVQTKPTRAGDLIAMAGAKFAELPGSSPTQADRKADSSEKPVGEWNTADITVNGDTIECSINGVAQNKATKCVPGTGKIGMQLEGYPFELRNVKLSPLAEVKK